MTKRTFGLLMLYVLTPMAGGTQTAYRMAGPYEVIARDGAFSHTKAGSERDMRAALDLAREGRLTEALAIVNAYAATLQRLEGHDAPLCAIQCYDLVRAMTVLSEELRVKSDELRVKSEEFSSTMLVPSSDSSGIAEANSPLFSLHSSLIRRALVPMMEQFEADSPYANGNWGAIVNRLRMACAIYLNDAQMYQEAVDYYLHAYDNGSLAHYISETGQCQETGRDQAHVQLGLEALAQTCEMAWERGDDLWGALDNRLMKGFEYTAKYNLGCDDVPFETWQDCTGLYCNWTEPGQMGRGKLWNIYELPYNHYVRRMGLQMPYTERIVHGEKPKATEKARLHQMFAYPAPKGAPLKHDYEVYVQPRGGKEWKQIDTYMAKVNALQPDGKHKVSEMSYAMFDFTGDVFVRVVSKRKKIKTARIRPDYRGVIAHVKNDSTVQFLLFQPENVSIEMDGGIADNLLLFTSRPPVSKQWAQKEARRQKRTFVCYAPGLYTQDTIRVASNSTLYLEGGSYFTGTFAIEDAHDVSILGRGVARPESGYEGCHIHRSRNILVDGLTVNTCPIGGSDGVTLRNVRSISHPAWGDGLNVFASSNVLFDRVFCRNSDDCTTAYATRKGFRGNTRNVRMRNATLWADVAHPIFIGIHGDALRGDTIENLVYENIDILGQAEPQVDYQGCLAINCGDNNVVRNVCFDNIRIEDIAMGSFLQVKVGYNQKYCAAPGRAVEGVTFRHIRYKGRPPLLSVINGYDAQRRVRGVVFEGFKINGRTIYDNMPGQPGWYATSDHVPMFVGNHVEGIRFARSSPVAGSREPKGAGL